MKRMLMIAVMSLSMTAVFASNGLPKPVINKAIINAPGGEVMGRALAAIKSSCPNAQGNLNYSSTVTGICTVDGFITTVTFWRVPNCPPNVYCIQVVIPVGSVTLGCNNEVISVSCGGPVAI